MKAAEAQRVLGVSRTMPIADIKKQYRKKALKVHPDKAGGSSVEFIKLKEALDVLTQKKSKPLLVGLDEAIEIFCNKRR